MQPRNEKEKIIAEEIIRLLIKNNCFIPHKNKILPPNTCCYPSDNIHCDVKYLFLTTFYNIISEKVRNYDDIEERKKYQKLLKKIYIEKKKRFSEVMKNGSS